jgi:hypothetical protein
MSIDCANSIFNRFSNYEKELEELFGEVKKMIKMGKKNDAIDLLNANYEMVKERLNAGTKGIEEAAILDILALGYIAVGDMKSVGCLLNLVFFSSTLVLYIFRSFLFLMSACFLLVQLSEFISCI